MSEAFCTAGGGIKSTAGDFLTAVDASSVSITGANTWITIATFSVGSHKNALFIIDGTYDCLLAKAEETVSINVSALMYVDTFGWLDTTLSSKLKFSISGSTATVQINHNSSGTLKLKTLKISGIAFD